MEVGNVDANSLVSLKQAYELKDEANKAYSSQDYQKAIRFYHQCLLCAKGLVQLTSTGLQELARAERPNPNAALVSELINLQANEPSSSSKESAGTERTRLDSTSRGEEMHIEAKGLITKCYSNLAACILAGNVRTKDDFMRAVSYCDIVLRDEPNNEKALFRKGVALMKADSWEKAIEQFAHCKENAKAKLHILECQKNIDDDRKRRDDKIRANFAKACAAEQVLFQPQQNGNGHNAPPPPPPNPPTMNGHVQHQ